jgi:hypothetical protein
LNKVKNTVAPPDSSQVVQMSLTDMRGIAQPKSWQVNQNRDQLKGPKREGQPVQVMAYLWKAKREHGESCNCGLDAPDPKGQLLTDIHMVLTDTLNASESTSVTAEITPRVRAKRPNPQTWTWNKIAALQKKYIRVTGYLMLDTGHIGNPLVRATNWEVHPIMKLEVCSKTAAECTAGNGWNDVP